MLARTTTDQVFDGYHTNKTLTEDAEYVFPFTDLLPYSFITCLKGCFLGLEDLH